MRRLALLVATAAMACAGAEDGATTRGDASKDSVQGEAAADVAGDTSLVADTGKTDSSPADTSADDTTVTDSEPADSSTIDTGTVPDTSPPPDTAKADTSAPATFYFPSAGDTWSPASFYWKGDHVKGTRALPSVPAATALSGKVALTSGLLETCTAWVAVFLNGKEVGVFSVKKGDPPYMPVSFKFASVPAKFGAAYDIEFRLIVDLKPSGCGPLYLDENKVEPFTLTP